MLGGQKVKHIKHVFVLHAQPASTCIHVKMNVGKRWSGLLFFFFYYRKAKWHDGKVQTPPRKETTALYY